MQASKSTPTNGEHMPPHDKHAEQCVLGSMLRDNHVIDDVVQSVRADDFYADAHQKVFRIAAELHDRGKPVDLVILADNLKTQQWLDDVGGYAYLAELWDTAPTAANGVYYARIVREKSLCRSLMHLGGEMLRDAQSPRGSSEEMLAAFESRLFGLCELGIGGDAHGVSETLDEALSRIEARSSNQHGLSGLSTGLIDLDEVTAGLQNGELTIIGARPSVGKSSLGLHLARYTAVAGKQAVLFVSLEQSRNELVERLLSYESRVDGHKLRTGRLSADDHSRLTACLPVIKRANIWIDDRAGQNMLRIAANARRLHRKHDLRLVVVDYLQLVEPEDRRAGRYEQVGGVAKRLKQLARELNRPVVAMAQVGRDADETAPRLRDLRESGDIEADADMVILLHRPKGVQDAPIDVDVAKNRNGRTGQLQLTFLRSCMRFENHAMGSPFDRIPD